MDMIERIERARACLVRLRQGSGCFPGSWVDKATRVGLHQCRVAFVNATSGSPRTARRALARALRIIQESVNEMTL